MVGQHGASLIVEMVQSGLAAAVDVKSIQQALLIQATQPGVLNGRVDVEHYINEGYVSAEAADKSATYTLDYALDDYLLAVLSR